MPAVAIADTKLFTDPNLIGYWKMDGDSTEEINGYDGTDTAMAYDSVYPLFGQSGYFNGSASKVVVADNATLDIGTSDFAISFWARPDSTQTQNYASFVAKRAISGSTDIGYAVGVSNASGASNLQVAVDISDGGTRDLYYSAANVITSLNWHNIIVNFDRDGYSTIYVDGSASGTPADISDQNGSIANSLSLDFGERISQRWFKGRMDDIAIFNRLLTLTEINGIANGFPKEIGSPLFFRGGAAIG